MRKKKIEEEEKNYAYFQINRKLKTKRIFPIGCHIKY